MTSGAKLPSSYQYTKIFSLQVSPSANFYGRVVQYQEPRPTRGSDWIMSMVVIDDSFEGQPDLNSANPSGLTVVMFRAAKNLFPAVRGLGDIVQFRHFRVQMHENRLQALSTNWSAFTVFHQLGPQEWQVIPDRLILEDEREVLGRISNLQQPPTLVPVEGQAMPPISAPQLFSAKRPTITISEIRPGMYFNGYFQIVKVFSSLDGREEGHDRLGQVISLLVTDFTENPMINAQPENYELTQHLTHSLLNVTLWDNFAEEAHRLNLRPGLFIYLDNLTAKQVRFSKDGHSDLKASLHGDPSARPGEHVKIVREEEERAQRIVEHSHRLTRLKETAAAFSTHQIPEIEAAVAVNPAIPIASRKRPTRRTFAIPASALAATTFTATDSVFSGTKVAHSESVAITTILALRSYPSDNAKFCIKARIVNFFPDNVWNFARRICGRCGVGSELLDLTERNGSCVACNAPANASGNRYIWTLGLILEDATGDLPAILAEEDATEFFNYPAFDMLNSINGDQRAVMETILKKLQERASEEEQLFCLQSYRVHSQDLGNFPSIRYRIFNTRMF